MRKAALIVIAVAVAVMFAVPAFAAESTPCSSCAKPCSTCAKPCAKPCSTCSTPCAPLPKVSVNWVWPTMKIEPCAPCAAPCPKPCVQYKRDVIGNKIPNQTYEAGNAMTDKATNYEATLVSGQ